MTLSERRKAIEAKLKRIEKKLEKVRGCSPLSHGWQTQKLAKAGRSWDMLAQERINLQMQLEDCDLDSIRLYETFTVILISGGEAEVWKANDGEKDIYTIKDSDDIISERLFTKIRRK